MALSRPLKPQPPHTRTTLPFLAGDDGRCELEYLLHSHQYRGMCSISRLLVAVVACGQAIRDLRSCSNWLAFRALRYLTFSVCQSTDLELHICGQLSSSLAIGGWETFIRRKEYKVPC